MSFEEASQRTKRRRVDELVASTSAEALAKAADKIAETGNEGTISVEKALALYVDMDLSFRQYNMMRNVVNAVHNNCFPSYYSIVEAKKKLIPDGIIVSETEAHVPLQSILDKTAKFFECIIHIAYKIPVKSWRIVDEEQKQIVAENKKKIQDKFKNDLGLIIDMIKPGYGTSNDGNTARRFFANIEEAAQITGVDKTLITNFSIILRTLSSGFHINAKTFEKLLRETFILYINLYPWYYMPVTVHKVLVHGIDYVKYSNVPIGMLSEEAIESCYKLIRNNRLRHTRKTSRIYSNRDLVHYLILQSEPDISLNSQTNSLKRYDLNEIKDFVFIEEENIMPDICDNDEEI